MYIKNVASFHSPIGPRVSQAQRLTRFDLQDSPNFVSFFRYPMFSVIVPQLFWTAVRAGIVIHTR